MVHCRLGTDCIRSSSIRIEFDRETGKLSDEDYVSLKTIYQRAALAAIEAEEMSEARGTGGDSVVVCPSCGPRPESSAAFC